MKRLLVSAILLIVLCQTEVDAQTGVGYVSDYAFQYTSWLGLGVGVALVPHGVFSLSEGIASGETTALGVLFSREYALSGAYRFRDTSSTPYVFAGYRDISSTNGSFGFIEAGVGYDPTETIVRIYPELSVLVPLTRGVYWPGSMGLDAGMIRIPVIVKLTMKFYFDPPISSFWEESRK